MVVVFCAKAAATLAYSVRACSGSKARMPKDMLLYSLRSSSAALGSWASSVQCLTHNALVSINRSSYLYVSEFNTIKQIFWRFLEVHRLAQNISGES
jgi:hypothetical protein